MYKRQALELRENIKKIGAQMLGCAASEVDFDGKEVYIINPDGADNGAVSVSLSDIATKSQVNNTIPVDVTATYSSPVSPPPYMVGMVEIELDKETGAVKILDYQAVGDCGIPVNPNPVSYTHLALGTAKAMERGTIEGAMSSLSIVVCGVLTVVGSSIFAPVSYTHLFARKIEIITKWIIEEQVPEYK